VSWEWDFGDDTTSTDRNPSHTYPHKGTFTVKLTVTNNDGLTGTKSQSLTVVNLPPDPSFTFEPQTAAVGQSVRFDGSASIDRDGTISSYAWDFNGDGSADATGVAATRAFTTAGDCVVTLTVTDNDGSTAKRQETITGSTGAPALPRFDNLWAVVIGVGEYIDSHLGDLEGVPTDDAQAVYDFLMDTQGGGFPSDHVRLLVDEAATKNGIEQAWGWLLREAGENDLVLVYFSGHGGHGDDYNGDEPEGDTQDEYLLPYDTDVSDLYSTAVRDDTVGDWVKSLRSEHVVLIFDSCHSGGAARTVKAYESPGVRASPGNTVFTDLMGEEGVLVMAACHATEYAQQDDALGHGVFTYYLLRGLGGADLAESAEADVNDDGRVTVEELRAYVEREVPQYVRDVMGESSPQNPEIIGDEALGSAALSGYGVPLLGEVTALDGDRVVITLGTRHGVQPGDRFEVVGVYTLPDGTTMRETRATIEVLFILGPERSVCRIVEQGFPIEVHDVVTPAP
jgi:chitodextrinase